MLKRREFLRYGVAGVATLSFDSAVARCVFGGREMTHRQRIEAVLAHRQTDRAPFAFWWHFPNQDRSPRRLAELSLQLQKRLDLDFIKFSPYGLYSVADWGVVLDVAGGDVPPTQAEFPIREAADWKKLRPLRADEGEYLVLLEAQRIALAEMTDDVPFTMTVFSPLTSAAKMAGPLVLSRHLEDSPKSVHAGLEIITETTRQFVTEVMQRGADGIFFASQMVDANILTQEQHREFARPYDLEVLEATRGAAWFNIFHLHGERILLDEVLDYPVHAFNYHDRDYGPSLAEMRTLTDRCLIGGISPVGALVNGTPADVDAEVKDAWQQLDGRGLIVGPGEVVSLRSRPENVDQLATSIARTAKRS